MSSTKDTWNSIDETSQNSYWEIYARGRPQIPHSTWKLILDYHKEHGNGFFDQVLDLGSGPGTHSIALRKHFSHVTLIDPSEVNIIAAKEHLKDDTNQYTFQVGRAEDMQAMEVFDMVFMANSLHWVDPSIALPKIATSLKPGGTFVAMLFGHPDGIEPRAWQAYLAWFRSGVDSLAKSLNSEMFGFNVVSQETGYDCVRFNPVLWRDVKRIRLNLPKPRYTANEHVYELYKGSWSEVTADEEVVQAGDTEWRRVIDVQGLKDVINTFPMPAAKEEKQQMLDVIEKNYADGKAVERVYGVHIVLATKR